MAREKKSVIGLDPLAWLDDDRQVESDSISDDVKNKIKRSGKKKNISKIILISDYEINESELLKGYDLIAGEMDEVLECFYNELFRQYPDIKLLFKNTTERLQAIKFAAAIKLLIDNVNEESVLRDILLAMGVAHQGYGVLPEHYPVVVDVLMSSFKKKVGRSWTKAVAAAWTALLTGVVEIMSAACDEQVTDTGIVDEYVAETDPMTVENSVVETKCPVLELCSVQDISKSQVLKNDILSLVNDNDEIDIDASEVERIDGSALQLLCALFIYSKQNNLIINWINPSDVFSQCVKISGMQKILELN